jgi:peptidoglycan/LPS O-acetylase OafA/YrhL
MWSKRSLAESYSPSDNGFGLLRLVLAFCVLVSHSWPIGLGRPDPGGGISHGQTSLGELSVFGFFVISGFLITASGRRFGTGRYLWHRGLRILPGLWVCLLVTAFLLAPFDALIERGTLAGFWGDPEGPVQYVVRNWFVAIRQYQISGLLQTHSGTGEIAISAFDGSLWSLVYEVGCYFMVAGLALLGVFSRARWVVLVGTVVGFGLLGVEAIAGPLHGAVFGSHGLDWYYVLHLTYLFLLGALAQLYADRLILNDGLALIALAVFGLSVVVGGLPLLGYPAFAYLVLWAGIRLPTQLRGIGRRRDYSYGFYVYAFPVQQILQVISVPRLGMGIYIGLSTVGTFALAIPSWHLVERPAMSFKNRTFRTSILSGLVQRRPEERRPEERRLEQWRPEESAPAE